MIDSLKYRVNHLIYKIVGIGQFDLWVNEFPKWYWNWKSWPH